MAVHRTYGGEWRRRSYIISLIMVKYSLGFVSGSVLSCTHFLGARWDIIRYCNSAQLRNNGDTVQDTANTC